VAAGAHNINLVTPSHFVRGVRAALVAARAQPWFAGVPVVYNTSAYDSVDALASLEGLVDVYLPDLKYADDASAEALSGAPGYVEAAHAAIREMLRQTGPPVYNAATGLMLRGTLIRHLILPGRTQESLRVIDWIADYCPPGTPVSLMSQYVPHGRALGMPGLGRKLTRRERERVQNHLFARGLTAGYVQELGAANDAYIPAFLQAGDSTQSPGQASQDDRGASR